MRATVGPAPALTRVVIAPQKTAVIKTDEDLVREKKQRQRERAAQQQRARERKERMIKLEEERKRTMPPSKRETEKRKLRDETRRNGAARGCGAGLGGRLAYDAGGSVGRAQRSC